MGGLDDMGDITYTDGRIKEDTVKKIEEFTLIGQDAWHYTHIFTTIEENANGKLSLLVWDMDENHRIDLPDPNAFIDQVLETGVESIDNNAYDYCCEDAGKWTVHIRYDDKDICIRGMAYIPDEVCRLRALLGIRYSHQSPKRGAYHKMEESERIEWIQSIRRIDRWRRNELIKNRWQEEYLVCKTGVAGRIRLGVKEGCRGSEKTSMATIKAKLGFDPLTYKIKNEDHSTGDGAYNPFSILTNEELDYVMDTIRNQNKGKDFSEGE